jgi:Tfp pilus assembly protein PilF
MKLRWAFAFCAVAVLNGAFAADSQCPADDPFCNELEPEEGHTSAGIAAANSEDFPRALKHFLAAEKQYPDDYNMHNNVAMIYLKTGELFKAREHYKIALKLSPLNDQHEIQSKNVKEITKVLGDAYNGGAESGQFALSNDDDDDFDEDEDDDDDDKPKKANKKAAAKSDSGEEKTSEASALGVQFAMKDQFDQALPHFMKALETEPRFWRNHNNLAMTYMRLARNHEALQHYHLALKCDPDNDQADMQRRNVELLSEMTGIDPLDLEGFEDEEEDDDEDEDD